MKAAVERIQALADKGWSVVPDFHWGAQALGVANARHGRADLQSYCDFWVKEIGEAAMVRKADWDGYWRGLEQAGIVGPEDREAFDAAFTNTQRLAASPRPGICCEIGWDLDVATRLDNEAGRFQQEVRARMDEVLLALGEPTVAADEF